MMSVFPDFTNIDLPPSDMMTARLGKMPLTVPNAEQIGRVNFIKNVSSGGNLLNNRSAFDQYGGNISIGKVALP